MFPAEFKRGTAPQGNPSTIAKTAEAAANHSAVASFTNSSRTPRRIAHSCQGAVEILEKLAVVAMFLWSRCKLHVRERREEFIRVRCKLHEPTTERRVTG